MPVLEIGQEKARTAVGPNVVENNGEQVSLPAAASGCKEKRGEVEPEDLSGDLLVQLATVTEHLNRH